MDLLDASRQMLVDAARDGACVRVRVSCCEYRCCGAGWRLRTGPQSYRGLVMSVGYGEFLLEVPNPLRGKRADVLARFSDLLTLETIVD